MISQHRDHGAVLAHDLAAQAAFMKARQAAEIHSGLCVSVPLQNPVGLGQEREHMAGSAEILRLCIFLHTGHRCHGALLGGDSGRRRDMIDRDRESGLMIIRVGAHHLRNLKFADIFFGHRHADQTFAVCCHKVDVFCRGKFRSTDKITFIFPVGIIHDQNDLAVSEILQCLFNRFELIHILILSL